MPDNKDPQKQSRTLLDKLVHNGFNKGASKLVNRFLVTGENEVLGKSVRDKALDFVKEVNNPDFAKENAARPQPTTLLHNPVGASLSRSINKYLVTGEDKVLGASVRDKALDFAREATNKPTAAKSDQQKSPTTLLHNPVGASLSRSINKYLVTGEDKVLGASAKSAALNLAQEINNPGSAAAKKETSQAASTTLLNNPLGKGISKFVNRTFVTGENKVLGASAKEAVLNFAKDVKSPDGANSEPGKPGPTTVLNNAVGRGISRFVNRQLTGEDKVLGASARQFAVDQARSFFKDAKAQESVQSSPSAILTSVTEAVDQARPSLESKDKPVEAKSNAKSNQTPPSIKM